MNEEENVKNAVLGIYEAVQNLDAKKLDSYFSHSEELLAFGQQWASRRKSIDEIAEEHQREFQHVKSIRISGLGELEAHVRENVAWAADRAHQIVETKDGKTFESDLRTTLVFERVNTESPWLIIQWHVSRGA